MPFFADLHIHSRYSRATSRDLNLETLAVWARKKGLAVLGTGDFTHPAWMAEIRDKLVPAEPGLFRLRPDLEREVERRLSGAGGAGGDPVRYLLQVEISTIYKKGEQVRKVHHLLYAPDLASADRIVERLARIGNLAADGRPILGLDSRDLLEITLEAGEGCYLIPAHIWTPWFSALGSKSGFDSIEECYGDLADRIFAVETGLSSDPPMNRRLSSLDGYTLVSNSDAHSPANLGREACVFDCALDYFAMRRALETGEGYGGTTEFFAEEGKYHLDGHRGCGVRLEPAETQRLGGRCPDCGKPLTVGVLHRVYELADRAEADVPDRSRFLSLVPLAEVLSEIAGVGVKSKTVRQAYEGVIGRVGSELTVLTEAPLEELERGGSPLLAEAIRRMRAGQVIREPGYDGEYGIIRLFTADELSRERAGGLLFEVNPPGARAVDETATTERASLSTRADIGRVSVARHPAAAGVARSPQRIDPPGTSIAEERPRYPAGQATDLLAGLDRDQRLAAEFVDGPLLIVAGPGTGKTRTLTHRLAHLVANHGVPPEHCLAITFTRRAAEEMRERLGRLLAQTGARIPVTTFHGLGLVILREDGHRLGLGRRLRVVDPAERIALLGEAADLSPSRAARLLERISRLRRGGADAAPETARAAVSYRELLRSRGCVDFDDLIELPIELLERDPQAAAAWQDRFRHVSVDEFQDLDARQYRLLQLLVPPEGHLCVIGDPDQSIYGFRGGDPRLFERFRTERPATRVVHLTRNYRSTRPIVAAALQAIDPGTLVSGRVLETGLDGPEVQVHELPSEGAEAEFVVHTTEAMIGGSSMFSFDSERVASHEDAKFGLSDFAVLYRTDAQAEVLEKALSRSGIPFQRRSHRTLIEHPSVRALVDVLREQPSESSLRERLDSAAEHLRASHGARPEVTRLVPALRPLVERYGTDLDGFLSELAMGIEADLWDERAERVSLLTLHAVKGLEFRVVFVVGCEDGLLPLRWGAATQDLEEERRLFFVGITRARERLVLTHARRRQVRGETGERAPSPFLDDLREVLRERHQPRSVPAAKQFEMF